MENNNCPYCDDPLIKERTIISNDLAWAFPTNIPIVPGHVLVTTKRHTARFEDLTEEERAAIFEILSKIKEALMKTFQAEGFNHAWNEGELAGQSIPHFHFHVLPRKSGDTGITEYEPRQFLYRPGSREKTPEDELSEVAKLIKNNL